MSKYSVLVVGMGKRGMHHATAFNANPRFQVTGICDIDQKRLDDAAAKLGNPQKGTDAAALAKALKPDVFCFCTLPHLRTPFIKAAIEGGAKLVAFEKPVTLTSAELFTIRDLLKQSGAKAVVSHQHRYGKHYQKVKEIVASGALGRVHTVYASATGWMTHMLSHLIDYTCWFNGYVPGNWAMAQVAGGAKFSDNHPSPDYIGGFVQFANGVRGIYECGAGAPDQPEVAKWWGKNRIGAQGTEGFAEVLTNGGWRAVTKSGGWQTGEGAMNYDLDMPPYIQEMADWLDNKQAHQCNFEHASLGAEIMLAMQRSAAEGGQIALPLTAPADEQTMLKAKVAGKQALVSFDQNRKEFGYRRSDMEVIIQPNRESAAFLVARIIAHEIRGNPHLVLGLATGATMERVYRHLVQMHKEEQLDFSLCSTFNLDEYVGLFPSDQNSYRHYMEHQLFRHVNIDSRNTHLPNGMANDFEAECRQYESLIHRFGGIDLQLLGIGKAGHIGFNEPLSALRSRTRVKALTPTTLKQNAAGFGSEENMPRRAITMGVGTIIEARRCILLATGDSKANVVAQAVEGPITSMVSASALQLHPRCTVIVDEEAAAGLHEQEYYRWIFENEPEWQSYR